MTRPTGSTEVDWTARADRVYAGYLWAQAVLGVVLWVAIWSSDTVRRGFEVVESRPDVTNAFAVADLAVVVVASAASAWAVQTRASWAVLAVGVTVGAVLYPTLFLVGWVWLTDDTTLALAVMLPVSVLTCWVAVQVWRGRAPDDG